MKETNNPGADLTIQQLVHDAIAALLEDAGDDVEKIEPLVTRAIDSVANRLFDSIAGWVPDQVRDLVCT